MTVVLLSLLCLGQLALAAPVFRITHTGKTPVTGRVFVAISTDTSLETEPRDQISDDHSTQQLFGIDVSNLSPGQYVQIDSSVLGYPVRTSASIPAGSYAVQAIVQPYDRYRRGDGTTVWLPRVVVNKAGNILRAPGTLSSRPVVQALSNSSTTVLSATMVDPDVPFVGPANDTDYIKHVSIRSPSLSEFWGRDIFLEACVLLPYGWADHPDARYPMVVYQGHYSDDWATPVAFSEQPPAANLTDLAYVQALYAYYLYRNWTDPDGLFKGRRVLVMTVKHPTPFFDDSYAVNSANMGPYGDAIHLEFVPAVERMFRGLAEPWARTTFGGSTGGWEAMAAQVLYPDSYNGAWVACPDPIDFRAYTTVNLYEDENAYYYNAPWKRTARPGMRDEADNFIYPGSTMPMGQTTATIEELNLHELVLGTNSRSCGQFDIWEATFSPLNRSTGYPVRLWDKLTGAMNPDAIAYARDNYDLSHIMKRDWETLGPKLLGKLTIYVGGSDTWFLNNAVMLVQDFLETTTQPHYAGRVIIGNSDGRGYAHCWSGDDTVPNSIGRLTYNQRLVPEIVDRILATAPQGADVTSWRY
eukprot:m.231818 g.231818  ORF g.231818 m.231818 type:complete len:584 (-) comp12265_c0_seq1:144-1895(-)